MIVPSVVELRSIITVSRAEASHKTLCAKLEVHALLTIIMVLFKRKKKNLYLCK